MLCQHRRNVVRLTSYHLFLSIGLSGFSIYIETIGYKDMIVTLEKETFSKIGLESPSSPAPSSLIISAPINIDSLLSSRIYLSTHN